MSRLTQPSETLMDLNVDVTAVDPLASNCPVRCCSLAPKVLACFAFAAVLATAGLGYLVGRSQGAAAASDLPALTSPLPLIHATASVTSEKFSMATGDVSDEAEGLFVLDHNSGLLQCSVMYPRRGQFMARFTVNVAEALGTGGKGGQYMMVTGRTQFPRASNRPAGGTVIYVMDTATGNYACYGVPFDHTAVPRNQPQQGLLVLIATGSANPVVDRDDLR